jgi:hypothetical protein
MRNNPRVLIQISGGNAFVYTDSKYVDISVIDWDNYKCLVGDLSIPENDILPPRFRDGVYFLSKHGMIKLFDSCRKELSEMIKRARVK